MRQTLLTLAVSASCLIPAWMAQAETSTSAVIESILGEVIRPDHVAFANAAGAQKTSLNAFCASPTEDGLTDVQEDFKALVLTWSKIEPYRIGPAREGNLYEKIFYWPDRKGRGLRQVRKVIAEEDQTAATPETLSQKSVAVQGLPALEYVLFDAAATDLLTSGSFRCVYAKAIAGTLVQKSLNLAEAWSDPNGFSKAMSTPSAEAHYRSDKEVLQDFLRIVREQLGFISDLKLGSALGTELAKAKPKRAPFWRSGITLASLLANISTVERLLNERVNTLIPDEHQRFADSVRFELGQVKRVLAQLIEADQTWIALVEGPETYDRLSYLRLPLSGASAVVEDRYAPALGLTLGFNSLDGD